MKMKYISLFKITNLRKNKCGETDIDRNVCNISEKKFLS